MQAWLAWKILTNYVELYAPKKSNVTTSKIPLKKNPTDRQQSEMAVKRSDSLQKNIICFCLPQSYSSRVNVANQIHVQVQCAPT